MVTAYRIRLLESSNGTIYVNNTNYTEEGAYFVLRELEIYGTFEIVKVYIKEKPPQTTKKPTLQKKTILF